MESLKGKTAMRTLKIMRRGRERTDYRTVGKVKGKWSHCSLGMWFLLFISSRKMQHLCVSFL